MASLTITIADAQVPRLLAAFGHWEFTDPNDPSTRHWVPATVVEIRDLIKKWAIARVQEYEVQLAVETAQKNGVIDPTTF